MSRKILVVDDDRAIANLLRIILQQAGFTTGVAYTEQTFRDAMKEFDPDLILLDLMIEDQNGVQIYEKLLEEGERKRPVFVLSAAMKGVSAVTGASGVQYPTMGKPFNSKELISSIKKQLP